MESGQIQREKKCVKMDTFFYTGGWLKKFWCNGRREAMMAAADQNTLPSACICEVVGLL